ncbi:hypothetical protein QBC32DRAFT_49935 [Pseudoneurospora amorphoporcata]|uniref:Uncharacterized protein n=1 Tax=Pseudoneurospora amorphoporcata TaxID=241081 RepID=A0AAN6SDB6_9PEZI|nr:hypothetical protein QBC32DRAFT_49935 [Pseudoneurospora amorphoporcata]
MLRNDTTSTLFFSFVIPSLFVSQLRFLSFFLFFFFIILLSQVYEILAWWKNGTVGNLLLLYIYIDTYTYIHTHTFLVYTFLFLSSLFACSSSYR